MNRVNRLMTLLVFFGVVLHAATPCFAQSRTLELRQNGFFDGGDLKLDLYYTPETNGQTNPGIRTTVVNAFVLFDVTKFNASFSTTIDNPTAQQGPTTTQRNALAPTHQQISVLEVGEYRTLSSFNTSVDILGANPTGYSTTLALFDGDYTIPNGDPNAAVVGLKFPAAGFKLGTYTFSPTRGDVYTTDTVIGFADALITSGQTLNSEEMARVEVNPASQSPLTVRGIYRFATPAPSSLAILLLGLCLPLAFSRRMVRDSR